MMASRFEGVVSLVWVSVLVVTVPALADAGTAPGAGLILDRSDGRLVREVEAIVSAEAELAELQRSGAPDLLERELSPVTAFASTASSGGVSNATRSDSEASADGEEEPSASEKEGVSEADRANAAGGAPAGLRVLAEFGGGALMSVVGVGGGGLAGVTVGLIVAAALLPAGGAGIVLLPALVYGGAVIGGALGGATLLPLGVWKAGDWTGGEGALFWTYTSALVGIIAGIIAIRPVANAVQLQENTNIWGQLAISAAIPAFTGTLTGMIGYELSHGAAQRSSETAARTGPRIGPAFSLVGHEKRPGEIAGATAGIRVAF